MYRRLAVALFPWLIIGAPMLLAGKPGVAQRIAVEALTDQNNALPEFARLRIGVQGVVSIHGTALTIAFSGDAKLAAFQEGAGIRVLDTASFKEIALLTKDGKGPIHFRNIVLSNDGKKLAAQSGPIATVWDVENGKTLFEVRGVTNCPSPLAFSGDGKQLISCSPSKGALVWDADNGKELCKLEGHEGDISCVTASPDGKHFVTGGLDTTVRIWDSATGKLLHTCEGHRQNPTSLAVSADGKWVASNGSDNTIRVWNVAKGELETKIRAHQGTMMAFSPDGTSIFLRDFIGLRAWDLANKKEKICLDSRTLGLCVGLSPNGMLAASVTMNCVRFWDLKSGLEIGARGAHATPITNLELSNDGKFVASCDWAGELRTWDLASGKMNFNVHEYQSSITNLAWDPTGSSLYTSSGFERFISKWNVKNSTEEARFKVGGTGTIYGQALSPDGQTIAVASSDQRIRLFDSNTTKLRRAFPTGHIKTLSFGSNGKNIIGVTIDGVIKVWDLDGKELRQAAGPTFGLVRTFSSDGSLLAGRTIDSMIRLVDTETCKIVRFWKDDSENALSPIALSPEGRMAAVATKNGTVRLFETWTGNERRVLKGHVGPISSLCFGPQGETLVSGGVDRSIVVWDVYAPNADKDKVFAKEEAVKQLWEDLASDNAKDAYRAIALLRSQPGKAVPLLRANLKEARRVDEQELATLLVKLDDEKQKVRDEAADALESMGGLVEDQLRKHLETADCSEEARRRIEKILERLDTPRINSEQLRTCRAIEILESLPGDDAQQVLEKLAAGPASAKSTTEAKTALARRKK